MITLRASAAFTAALLLASAASAASVTFDFSNSHGNPYPLPNSFSTTEGGLSVTASAKSIQFGRLTGNTLTGGIIRDAQIGRYAGGIGVTSGYFDNHQVDGSDSVLGLDEYVEFSFGQEITLHSVNFDLVGCDDDFRWGYDSNGNGSYGIGDFLSGEIDIPNSTIFANFGGVESSVFTLGAFGGNDEWKIRSMTVNYEPVPVDPDLPSPVPLPAPILLLAGGLGGLGAFARRRK